MALLICCLKCIKDFERKFNLAQVLAMSVVDYIHFEIKTRAWYTPYETGLRREINGDRCNSIQLALTYIQSS